jgi:hypothetical protein
MFLDRPHRVLLAVSVLVAGVHGGVAAAGEPDASVRDTSAPSAVGPLTQEYAGFEGAPMGFAFGGSDAAPPELFQPGGGAIFRFGRHRWELGYLTPAQVGFFFSEQTMLLHAQVEGGFVFPRPLQRLEVGVGAGIGLLEIAYAPTGCDGSCKVGGVGPLFSPVLRYLFIDGPRMSVGASVRAVIPVKMGSGNWGGTYLTGTGQLALAAIDVAFGSGR